MLAQKHRLVFIDRLLATLVHLRHGATHYVLACWFGVDRSTITRAIGEVRPLLAERGCTVAAGIRLPHRKSKKTRRTGTRRSTNASARPTPHAVSASSTASHTSRTGDHSPALWGDVGSSSDPDLMGSRLEGLSRMSRWTRGRRSIPDRRLPPLT
ncbi:transposase family protein [Streptomyces sp. NPDC056944]|uniref:helix-turn-helix domain-containing protein n=1 Tax=Streptomyces sp. NPDC056944 TaxID=3345972 RepID=UPI003641AC0B